jgi:hypothetical protein
MAVLVLAVIGVALVVLTRASRGFEANITA